MKASMMVRFIISFSIMLFVINLPYVQALRYLEWKNDITLYNDSTFTVREIHTIGPSDTESFFKRVIDLDGQRKITGVKVSDEKGMILNESEAEIQYDFDKIKIKIPVKPSEDKKTWIIDYLVSNGIRFSNNKNELKWNVFSSGRQGRIDKIEVIITLPEEVPKEKIIQSLLVVSENGQKVDTGNFSVASGNTFKYWGENINSRHSFIVSLKFPLGMLKIDRWRMIMPYLWFVIPVLVFNIVFWKWRITSHNPRAKKRIIPNSVLPEDISPAGMSALIEKSLGPKEITATIIDLANRGYIRIIEQDKKNSLSPYKHILQRLRDYDDYSELREHERVLLRHIFAESNSITLDDLKNIIRNDIERINRTVWNELINNKYIRKSPRDIKKSYTVNGILIIIVGLFAFAISRNAGIAITLAGIIILIFGRLMSHETKDGFEVIWYSLGFRKYMEREIKSKVNTYRESSSYSEYLPYAIIFQLEKEWTDLFYEIDRSLPDWYYPSKGRKVVSALEFVKMLSSAVSGDTNN